MIVNQYCFSLPKETEEGIDRQTITAVLTQGHFGSQAVYVGIGSPEFVAKHGTKQTYDRALYYFPMLKKEDYRR